MLRILYTLLCDILLTNMNLMYECMEYMYASIRKDRDRVVACHLRGLTVAKRIRSGLDIANTITQLTLYIDTLNNRQYLLYEGR